MKEGEATWCLVSKYMRKVKVAQLCPTLCDPMDYTVQEFFRPEFPSPGDFPNPGIKPRSPALQADSSSAEPQGKPKNTAMGSLSLLQWIFPTQKSNPGFLHWRRILYSVIREAHEGGSLQTLIGSPSSHYHLAAPQSAAGRRVKAPPPPDRDPP